MIKVLFMAVVGGIIGWITNVLAIKMLFRPLNPITIPLTKFTIQGLIPKRRNQISKSIGEAVENELINMSDILEKLITSENKRELLGGIKAKISTVVDSKLPSLIPSGIRSKISEYIGEQIDKEGEAILDKTIQDFTSKAAARINIGQMVEDKINEFELEKVESIILGLSSRELKHIEILGGILGVIIGLVQGLIVLVL